MITAWLAPLLSALLAFPNPPAASHLELSSPYGRVLRAFNPALGAPQALFYARHTIAEADAQKLDARFLVAVIAIESSWRPSAVSPAGAVGLGQLMPATAAGLRVDPRDPFANITGTARHLRALFERYREIRGRKRYELVLGAYNAGTGAIDRYGTVPPYRETQIYVRAVMALWERLR